MTLQASPDGAAVLREPTRFYLGHVPVDRLTFDGALDAIEAMIRRRSGGIVFTPNVDHVVLAERDEALRRAYARADLALADGMPIVWASHLLGTPVPEKVSGSDLVPRLLDRAQDLGWRVYFFGGGHGSATEAVRRLRESRPRLRIAGAESPRVDMSQPPRRRRSAMERIRSTSPDVVLVGLGAPKQELWIDEVATTLRPAVLLGVGASLDFLAGAATRAPRWISESGLEWAYRLAREPRRMWRRYLVRDPRFLAILAGELLRRGRGPAP